MKLGNYLADCAARYPDKIAYVCGDERVTFGELQNRADALCHSLRQGGLGLGDRIALYLPNGSAVVDAMAAVGIAGAIIVPISNRLAPEEVLYILRDAEVTQIIFDPAFRDVVNEAHAELGFERRLVAGAAEAGEETLASIWHDQSSSRPPRERLPLEADDLVLGYTSGTSGHPKGAIGTHRAMIMVHGYMNPVEFDMNRHDRILITSPMAHRVGLSRVICMLCTGCSVVIMPRFDPVEAIDLIEREQVTIVSVVPTIARLLLPEIERRPGACKTLRKLLATGEAFPLSLKERLSAALPELGLYTAYAQTEGGFMTCLRPEEQAARPESVGRPVPGVEIRLVDEALNDVEVGEPGEALVRFGHPGELMTMREYYNRPEANAEALLEGGWLRTGDILRADDQGYLYFVDRAKDMIVSGGLNIYAKEVELALISHPSVADAAVFGVPDADFGESVVAYIELESETVVESETLIEHCKTRIASYKKPKLIRFERFLPRTASGKVMKGILREKESTRSPDSALGIGEISGLGLGSPRRL